MITDLDRPDPVSDRRPAWLLVALTALCVLAFISVAGAVTDRRGPGSSVSATPPVATPSVAEASWAAQRDLAPLRPVVVVPPSWQIPEAQLERAGASAVLGLPPGSYTSVTRVASPPTTGSNPSDDETLVQLRYRLSDDRVAVLARLPRSDPLRGVQPASYTASSLVVRGIEARLLTGRGAIEPTILLWSEGIRTYQLSSNVHTVAELVQIAEQLR